MSKIIIAIDGYSACGKSTLAKGLAAELGYVYIDSGAMYRAVTLYFLQNNIDIQDHEAVISALDKIHIHFENIDGGNYTFLNGRNVEKEIREMPVSQKVSPVAAIPEVRRAMVKLQQQMGIEKGIVMDGRDIGTVVFPDAELKLFLTAALDERVNRRYREIQKKGYSIDRKAVQTNLEERDAIDSNRSEGPLRQAKDAILLDSTNLEKSEQLAMGLALAKERIAMSNEQ